MRVSALFATICVAAQLLSPATGAETPLLTLENNPFSKPKILEAKPRRQSEREQARAEPVDLELTATMVSENSPMVIVDGQLLGIGDSIKGLRLVQVMEGKARFRGSAGSVTYAIKEEVQ